MPYARQADRAANNRSYKLTRRYNLTWPEYDRIFAAQGGRCAICQRVPRTMRLAVDHDHKMEGKRSVRGLLCMTCNRGLEYVVGAHTRVDVRTGAIRRCPCLHCAYWWHPSAQAALSPR